MQKPQRTVAERTETPRSIIGRLGEVATELAFSGRARTEEEFDSIGEALATGKTPTGASATIFSQGLGTISLGELQAQIQQLPKNIEIEVRKLAKETFTGLDSIRASIEEAYHNIAIIGKGESRYGTLPTIGYPDFVALTEGRPILIEVKNSAKENTTVDGFQASFYNSLGKTVGVVIQDLTENNGIVQSQPRMVLEQDAQALIVYPRLKTWKRVDEAIDLSPEVIEGVWRAKQLGVIGKSPETGCSPRCPHHRFGIELPVGNIENAMPLPLIFARGTVSLGGDLDHHYLRNYLAKVAPSLMQIIWDIRFSNKKVTKEFEERLKQMIREKFGFDEDTVKKLFAKPNERTRDPGQEEIRKEEAADIEPWEKLLPEKILNSIYPTAQGYGNRIYGLPRESAKVVRKASEKTR